MNIGAIITGWSKTMGLMNTTGPERELSIERLKVCGACDQAKENTFLQMINGNGEQAKGMYCGKCFCPCLEKSLTNDVCPLGKWDNLSKTN